MQQSAKQPAKQPFKPPAVLTPDDDDEEEEEPKKSGVETKRVSAAGAIISGKGAAGTEGGGRSRLIAPGSPAMKKLLQRTPATSDPPDLTPQVDQQTPRPPSPLVGGPVRDTSKKARAGATPYGRGSTVKAAAGKGASVTVASGGQRKTQHPISRLPRASVVAQAAGRRSSTHVAGSSTADARVANAEAESEDPYAEYDEEAEYDRAIKRLRAIEVEEEGSGGWKTPKSAYGGAYDDDEEEEEKNDEARAAAAWADAEGPLFEHAVRAPAPFSPSEASPADAPARPRGLSELLADADSDSPLPSKPLTKHAKPADTPSGSALSPESVAGVLHNQLSQWADDFERQMTDGESLLRGGDEADSVHTSGRSAAAEEEEANALAEEEAEEALESLLLSPRAAKAAAAARKARKKGAAAAAPASKTPPSDTKSTKATTSSVQPRAGSSHAPQRKEAAPQKAAEDVASRYHEMAVEAAEARKESTARKEMVDTPVATKERATVRKEDRVAAGEIAVLREKLAASEKARSVAAREVGEEMNELKDSVRSQKDGVRQAEVRQAELRRELKAAHAEVDAVRTSCEAAIKEEQAKAATETKKHEKAMAAVRAEAASLREQLSNAKEQLTSREAENADVDEQWVARQRESDQELRAAHAALEQQSRQHTEEIAGWSSNCDALEAEVDLLSKKLALAEEERTDAEAAAAEAKAEAANERVSRERGEREQSAAARATARVEKAKAKAREIEAAAEAAKEEAAREIEAAREEAASEEEEA